MIECLIGIGLAILAKPIHDKVFRNIRCANNKYRRSRKWFDVEYK